MIETDALVHAVTESMSDVVTLQTYDRSRPDKDNYVLAQIPLTGTPLQFTRIGPGIFDVWDPQHETSGGTTLSCSVWHDGTELAITQAFPNVEQAVSITLDATETVSGLSYTQSDYKALPKIDRPWLHHNCLIDPTSPHDSTIATVFGLNWEPAGNGDGSWGSTLVRLTIDQDTSELVGDLEPVFSPFDLTEARYRYGNALSLSPPGSDMRKWMSLSYANDHREMTEKERAFYLSFPLTDSGPEAPRFLFVNDTHFDDSSLVQGWQETFPELELIRLPDDPLTSEYPIHFPHAAEFFQVEASRDIDGQTWAIYRLVMASLGGSGNDKSPSSDLYPEVYMFDLYVPNNDNPGTSYVDFFCGLSLPIETWSHFDFVLTAGPEKTQRPEWIAAYTSNPHGEWFWLDLWQTDPDASDRCSIVGAQRHQTQKSTAGTAVPIWTTEIDPTGLYGPPITDVQIHLNADTLLPGLVP
ncbi:MAG TPA: hypothetical protein QGF58_26185 [Myxococcota bacterium]|nr:hypothetical protein [Myxococcota bacterium]